MKESQHGSSLAKPTAKVKPNQDEAIEPLLTVKEVAHILHIHPISCYRLCYKKKLSHLRLDGVGVRIRPGDLREYINNGRKHE